MASKELGSQPGFTPQAGAFGEAAAHVRALVKQGRMEREKAISLTEIAYRDTMFAQMQGIPVGLPDELPEKLGMFPGATNADGTVNFSKS